MGTTPDREPQAPHTISAEQWREMMRSAPPVDDDFARDLEQIRKESGPVGPSAWEGVAKETEG
jgi:hypothetical protein